MTNLLNVIREREKEFDNDPEISKLFFGEMKSLYWSKNYVKSFIRNSIISILEELCEEMEGQKLKIPVDYYQMGYNKGIQERANSLKETIKEIKGTK